jgi:hypothetical protein
MTPKEKAKELINKFRDFADGIDSESDRFSPNIERKNAKQCALLAVQEIILSAPFEPADTDWDEAGSSAQYWYPQKLEDSAKWWAEVAKEILES